MIVELQTLLLKFTLSLSCIVVFYLVFLSRLTFFKAIRFYFLLGICISMIIPFLQISFPVISNRSNSIHLNQLIQSVPYMLEVSAIENKKLDYQYAYTFMYTLYLAGLLVLISRILIQFVSYSRLLRTSNKISSNTISIYLSNSPIAPFSFFNSIFLSNNSIDSQNNQKIIEHELIHIRQKHSIDMILAEIVCILNWFNPLAWLLKKYIRQNLEFLADDIMLSRGTDIKTYQYLLLQTNGYGPYSLAMSFNFHSLKSRIMMMNQKKSHYLQRLRFLLLVPLTILLLFAFRTIPDKNLSTLVSPLMSADADTIKPKPVKRDYSVSIQHNSKGKQSKATVKHKNGSIETFDLTDEKSREDFYSKYDMPPPPPPPPAPAPYGIQGVPPPPAPIGHTFGAGPGAPPAPLAPPSPMGIEDMPPPPPPAPPAPPFIDTDLPENVESIQINDTKLITIKLKDGTIEKYNMKDKKEAESFTKKYLTKED